MSEGGSSNKNFGSGDNRWRGQIVDDSVWRDNILAGKYEDKDSVPGYGRRYKVRIFGEHDLGGDIGFPIPDEQLPWAHIELPVTAGSGAGNSKQTPALRQGNIVSGYWADGANKQIPIITGVIGNNEQTILGTEYPVPVTESGTSLAVSAFPNKQLRLPDLNARPKPPQTSLITKKPTLKEIAQEIANFAPGTPLDDLGIPLGRPRTPAILADLQKAAEKADARNLNPEQVLELSKYYVQRGINERKRQANSPYSPASPGATTEALGEHLKTASDIGRENKFQEKIVLASPDDVVDSATKAIQTISDNLTQQIKLYTNSLTDYAAATQRPGDDFSKMIKDSSGQISKYMKVIMQKVHEYTNKKMNAELTDVVAEMPCYMRAQFLDVKELNNENLLKSFNEITDSMGGLLEDILSQSLGIDDLVQQAQQRAAQSDPFTIGESFIEAVTDAATTTSFGSNDSTTDLSGVSQPYNSGQSYQVNDKILFEGREYINVIPSTGIEPSVFTSNWKNVSGTAGGSVDEVIPYQNEERKTYTKVPICYAEDIVGKVFSYNKSSINGAVEKAVKGMNMYVSDMQSQLDAYDATFAYKAVKDDENQVIALSDEEGLNDDRGGAGYTTQVSVATTFRGSVGNAGDQETGGGLTVDIRVSRGGPTGRAPRFTDADFSTVAGMAGKVAVEGEEHYWITLTDDGNNYAFNKDDGLGGTTPVNKGILYDCSTTGGSGTGATVDIYFDGGEVKAVRCKLPYTGSVTTNGYALLDELTIDATNATGGLADGGGTFVSGSGNTAKFQINKKMYQNVEGRLRGPIDDRGITISDGGKNYQVGQLVNVDQGPNPMPESGIVADAYGAGPGGAAADGGANASFTVVGVFDKGDKRAGVADDPAAAGGGSGGFSNMLSSLGGVLGNLTSALEFDNMPTNIFPFELPPNKALADYYTLGDAGQSSPDSEIPMMGEITKKASQVSFIPSNIEIPAFALPVNPQNINLKNLPTSKDAQIALNNTVKGWKSNAKGYLNDNLGMDIT